MTISSIQDLIKRLDSSENGSIPVLHTILAMECKDSVLTSSIMKANADLLAEDVIGTLIVMHHAGMAICTASCSLEGRCYDLTYEAGLRAWRNGFFTLNSGKEIEVDPSRIFLHFRLTDKFLSLKESFNDE